MNRFPTVSALWLKIFHRSNDRNIERPASLTCSYTAGSRRAAPNEGAKPPAGKRIKCSQTTAVVSECVRMSCLLLTTVFVLPLRPVPRPVLTGHPTGCHHLPTSPSTLHRSPSLRCRPFPACSCGTTRFTMRQLPPPTTTTRTVSRPVPTRQVQVVNFSTPTTTTLTVLALPLLGRLQ